ncbi:hypothetical protein ACJX0J_028776 [Zea mays]
MRWMAIQLEPKRNTIQQDIRSYTTRKLEPAELHLRREPFTNVMSGSCIAYQIMIHLRFIKSKPYKVLHIDLLLRFLFYVIKSSFDEFYVLFFFSLTAFHLLLFFIDA